MKTGYGFTEFENISEFRTWLNKQNVKRPVTRLQVHHMYLPDYSCWKTDNALRRQNNIKSFHKNTNKWADIAQHFSVFPDGHIVTGRSLNSTPIGIKGWNTNAICIEIYGNFDKDSMNAAQKEAVIALYGELCMKFNLTPSTSTIRPHCWFTASGTYLGDYNKSKSAKTCPGTNFMGYGNTKAAFVNNFYPAIKNYMSGKTTTVAPKPQPTESNEFKVKIIVDVLNIRKGPGTSYGVAGTVKAGEAFTIVEVKNGWYKLKSGAGWISGNSKYVKKV